ncbi:hypothetical protein C5469_17365 [Photorhabdus cinerea]|uniref:Uncharacterized protein n=1 Tax=Photorhabdus cinerea TaxID=471575 RepID=A0A7X5TJC4_9GAMM|nr:hypothetical protein [Photorhabdus cinerea]
MIENEIQPTQNGHYEKCSDPIFPYGQFDHPQMRYCAPIAPNNLLHPEVKPTKPRHATLSSWYFWLLQPTDTVSGLSESLGNEHNGAHDAASHPQDLFYRLLSPGVLLYCPQRQPGFSKMKARRIVQ